MHDLGLTHIALPVRDLQRSLDFYATYAAMEVVHRRVRDDEGREVAWISDRTRPFVVVLIETGAQVVPLAAPAHLGVACRSQAEVDTLCALASEEGRLVKEPEQAGPPVGYWATIADPDGHTLELTYGQKVGLAVNEESA
ncbi:MAG TPA: VOC family protein [Candidatus Krumholzibacteria bacterium]|nr:VOC family protein [Candidatus Krumholzibacteria bacterium]HRX52394.1 VOC family protein [Candidatus Krumholzibacteria bacterium]